MMNPDETSNVVVEPDVPIGLIGATEVVFEPSPMRTSGSTFAFARAWMTTVCSLVLSTAAVAGVFYPEGATTMHFAFEGSPNGDRPIVRPPAIYHADDGFGFVDSPGLIGTSRGVTAPKYFRFDVNLPAGTYEISVTLGGTPEESVTRIKAENHQPMVEDVSVARGQTTVKTFTVTVKRGAAGATALDADGRLTLEFEGTNPSLMKLDIKPAAKPTG